MHQAKPYALATEGNALPPGDSYQAEKSLCWWKCALCHQFQCPALPSHGILFPAHAWAANPVTVGAGDAARAAWQSLQTPSLPHKQRGNWASWLGRQPFKQVALMAPLAFLSWARAISTPSLTQFLGQRLVAEGFNQRLGSGPGDAVCWGCPKSPNICFERGSTGPDPQPLQGEVAQPYLERCHQQVSFGVRNWFY